MYHPSASFGILTESLHGQSERIPSSILHTLSLSIIHCLAFSLDYAFWEGRDCIFQFPHLRSEDAINTCLTGINEILCVCEALGTMRTGGPDQCRGAIQFCFVIIIITSPPHFYDCTKHSACAMRVRACLWDVWIKISLLSKVDKGYQFLRSKALWAQGMFCDLDLVLWLLILLLTRPGWCLAFSESPTRPGQKCWKTGWCMHMHEKPLQMTQEQGYLPQPIPSQIKKGDKFSLISPRSFINKLLLVPWEFSTIATSFNLSSFLLCWPKNTHMANINWNLYLLIFTYLF